MSILVRDEQKVLNTLKIPAIKGKSAYEIACENGFKGTEKEWLNSLQGENGSQEIYVGKASEAPKTATMVIDLEDENEYDGFFTDSKYDYLGKAHSSLKEVNDNNIEHVLRKVNVQKYEGSSITANNTYMKQINNVILKGVTKFKDLDTGDFIDRFEEGKNLELVGSKGNKLSSYNQENLFNKYIRQGSWGYDYCCNTTLIEYRQEGCRVNITGKGGLCYSGFTIPTSLSKGTYKFKCKVKVGSIGDTYRVLMHPSPNNAHNGTWGFATNKIVSTKKIEEIEYVGYFDLNEAAQNALFYVYGNNKKIEYYDIMFTKLSDKNVVTEHEKYPYKFSNLLLPLDQPLYSLRDACDYIDLVTGLYVKNIDIRAYQSGDESNNKVLTDKKITLYKLDRPIISKIDLQGQKIYSYDGTTHYTCVSELGYPSPTLSMEVPTDLASLVQEERTINKKLYNDQNIIINSQLSLYEAMSTMLLEDSNTIPQYIQDLYELAYERGIRSKEQEDI